MAESSFNRKMDLGAVIAGHDLVQQNLREQGVQPLEPSLYEKLATWLSDLMALERQPSAALPWQNMFPTPALKDYKKMTPKKTKSI